MSITRRLRRRLRCDYLLRGGVGVGSIVPGRFGFSASIRTRTVLAIFTTRPSSGFDSAARPQKVVSVRPSSLTLVTGSLWGMMSMGVSPVGS